MKELQHQQDQKERRSLFSSFQSYDSEQARQLLNYPVKYQVDANRVTTKYVHNEAVALDSLK